MTCKDKQRHGIQVNDMQGQLNYMEGQVINILQMDDNLVGDPVIRFLLEQRSGIDKQVRIRYVVKVQEMTWKDEK